MKDSILRWLDISRHQIEQRRRLIFPAVILFGFIIDWLTLNRADQIFDNIVFITHILITGAMIAVLYIAPYRGEHSRLRKYQPWFTLLLLFSLGSLFSGFFVIYFRSASLAVSFPFFLGILILFSMTEWKKDLYTKNLFPQLLAYYVVIFLYLIFFIPIIVREISSLVFIVSGLLSLIVIFAYIFLLRKVIRIGIDAIARKLQIGIFLTFIFINAIYFMSVIPPIPLALKSVGVYHEISKSDAGEYFGLYERSRWYPFLNQTDDLHLQSGDDVYVFAAIFAPARISTTLLHKWDWYNPVTRRWEEVNQIPVVINGGRDGGYRGYSKKSSLRGGSWRVRFTTENGQVLGIFRFTLEFDNEYERKLRSRKL